MTQLEFQALCRETSLLLQLPDVDQLGRDGQIELDGYHLGAFYDAEHDEAIHCFVDLGPVEPEDRMQTLERVLALNLELGRMHGESLGLDSESGHIVLRSEIQNLEQCAPESLAEWLRDYCAFAGEFQGLLGSVAGGQVMADMQAQLA